MTPQDATAIDIYGGKDPSQVPLYSIADVTHHLGLPQATVRSWVAGRPYPMASGRRYSEALIEIADPDTFTLSFQNLVEIHVLGAIRRRHGVRMSAVRSALGSLQKQLESRHPLADEHMLTDGKDLFVELYSALINASQVGQLDIKDVLTKYLSRIERLQGRPVRLYPFTTPSLDLDSRPISIDPRVQFGQPCVFGTGVATSVLAERWKTGESIKDLAADYNLSRHLVEEAVRYESRNIAA